MKYAIVLRDKNNHFIREKTFFSETRMDKFLKEIERYILKIKIPKKYMYVNNTYTLYSEILINTQKEKK